MTNMHTKYCPGILLFAILLNFSICEQIFYFFYAREDEEHILKSRLGYHINGLFQNLQFLTDYPAF